MHCDIFCSSLSVTEIFRDGRVKLRDDNTTKQLQRHRNYKNRYKHSETLSACKETPIELKAQNRHVKIIITDLDI